MTEQPLSPKVRAAYLELWHEYCAQIDHYRAEIAEGRDEERSVFLMGVMRGLSEARYEIDQRLGDDQDD